MVRQAHSGLQSLVEPVITGLGYEFVGLEYVPQGKSYLLRFYIDNEAGITVEDCTLVSRQVGALLEVEEPIAGSYRLEVSSPGMDRPLFTSEQFEKFCGNKVTIKLVTPVGGRRNFKGTLISIQDEIVVLDLNGDEVSLNLNNIEKARLVPEY